jgi:hypothetical protein
MRGYGQSCSATIPHNLWPGILRISLKIPQRSTLVAPVSLQAPRRRVAVCTLVTKANGVRADRQIIAAIVTKDDRLCGVNTRDRTADAVRRRRAAAATTGAER